MAQPDLIPLDVLLGNPERVAPQVSPDGTRMSYMAPLDGVMNVWVGPVGGEFEPVTRDTGRGIQGYIWAHNDTHLLYVQDADGDENWRLYALALASGEATCLTPHEGVQAQPLKVSKDRPDEILVGLNDTNPQLHDIYHCDLRTNELTKIADNPGFVGWLVDHDYTVRGGVAPLPDGGLTIMMRETEQDEFAPFVTFDADDALNSGPMGFTGDNKSLYLVSSQGANTGRLVRREIATGAEEVIAEDPVYDVSNVMVHPDTREIQAVAFDRERTTWDVLDPAIADDFAAIRELHPGDFGIIDRNRADDVWLVGFTADDGPVSYYAYHRGDRSDTFLFHHRAALTEHTLAPMEPFSFRSRDGLTIHGYLSFPPGADRTGLPTVVNVHGGPWHRDTWGFDPEAQLFANRGYLCVQVNFRGSTGYGKEFVNAGDREWGGKMQDDITDAVAHVIDQGYADPERVAIYGGSYGGYATLAGVAFTPDLYRCAVAIVGPSNLKTFIEGVPEYWKPMIALFHRRVGNPETDEAFLWERSPLSKADQVKVPLLIAHGANDPRVKLAETEQITAALKEKGIAHDVVVYDDEGHGFVRPENRLDFYRRTEVFLAEHLGGRAEA